MQPNRNFAAFIALAALATAAACSTPHAPTGAFHIHTQLDQLVMEIEPDGTFAIYRSFGDNALVLDTGIYDPEASTLTVRSDLECQGAEGVYHWSYDGNAIRLQAVHDCDERAESMTTGSWMPLMEE